MRLFLGMNNGKAYPWHEPLWENVERFLKRDKIPHALIFCGEKGLGKSAFIHQLSQKLLCQSGKTPCHQCNSCHLYEKGSHPDYIEITGSEGKQLIRIDDIRPLNDKITKTSFAGRFVVVIRLCEWMNINASNALLKLLEEPPGSCVFLLETNNISLLPKTISSRCVRLNFNADLTSNAYQLENILDDKIGVNKDKIIASLISLANGNEEPFGLVETWLKLDVDYILTFLTSWHLDAIKLKTNASIEHIINQDVIAKLRDYCKLTQINQLFTILDKVFTIKKHMANKLNINQELWMDDLVMALH